MPIEWDERKRLSNLRKHGLDFRDVVHLLRSPRIVWRSSHSGEPRWLTTGIVKGRYVTVVYTIRGDALRIISMRRARDGEKRRHQALHARGP